MPDIDRIPLDELAPLTDHEFRDLINGLGFRVLWVGSDPLCQEMRRRCQAASGHWERMAMITKADADAKPADAPAFSLDLHDPANERAWQEELNAY